MNKADLFKRQFRAQDEKVRNVVIEQWGYTNEDYTKRIEEVLATLQQYHAKCVWEAGYKPKMSQYISEDFDYDTKRSHGILSECEKSETFNQKIYPLIEELDYVLKELKEIKGKWWYKLITFWKRK